MKKIISLVIIVIMLISIPDKKTEAVVIPDSAIRLRVLANSNSVYDQDIKNIVRNKIQVDLFNLLNNSKTLEESRKLINDEIPIFNNTVNKIMKQYNQEYKISYGLNYFPKKEYKGVIYKEGHYESLLITLGEGKGDNWWCVLFPPLCLIEAQESKTEEAEYKFFIKELIDKYF